MSKKYKKPHIVNIIVGIVFLILFFLTIKLYTNKWTDYRAQLVQFITIAEAFIVLINFLPRRTENREIKSVKKKLSKASMFAIIFVIIAVPATILAGHYIFNNEKFNFISLLIIAELLIPFFLSFESKKPSVRELVLISVICALAVAGRIVFYYIPQFKAIGAMVIIAGICLGGEKGFMVGAISALVSNMFFAHGSWTPFQMLGFGAIGLVSGLVFSKGLLSKNRITVSIFGGIITLILYGGIANFQSLLFYPSINLQTVMSTYAMGFPFDLLHAVSTIFFLWFISEPMIEKIERIKTKYNIF